MTQSTLRMPPEWHPQQWLWIGFPHDAEEWPGFLGRAQDRLARGIDLRQRAVEHALLPGRQRAHGACPSQSASSACTVARTASAGWLASTTRKRPGSAAARAR